MKKTKNKKDYAIDQVLWRLLVLIISGIIFYFWNIFTAVIFIVNIVIALINKRPNMDLVRFSDIWLSELTKLLKYLLFISEDKPFPFNDIKLSSNI